MFKNLDLSSSKYQTTKLQDMLIDLSSINLDAVAECVKGMQPDEINKVSNTFGTALNIACHRQDVSVGLLELLVSGGADVNKTHLGGTVLRPLIVKSKIHCIDFLLSQGAKICCTGSSPENLLTVIQSKNIELIKKIFAADPENVKTTISTKPLEYLLAAIDDIEVFKLIESYSGKTYPFHSEQVQSLMAVCAIENNNKGVFAYLIQSINNTPNSVANWYQKNEKALALFCVERDALSSLQLLLTSKHAAFLENINQPVNTDNQTWLHIAAKSNAKKVLEFLLGNSPKLDLYDAHGMTPLYTAASNGNAECVELLAAKGADIDLPLKDNSKASPIITAMKWKYFDVVNVLLDYKANVTRSITAELFPILNQVHSMRIEGVTTETKENIIKRFLERTRFSGVALDDVATEALNCYSTKLLTLLLPYCDDPDEIWEKSKVSSAKNNVHDIERWYQPISTSMIKRTIDAAKYISSYSPIYQEKSMIDQDVVIFRKNILSIHPIYNSPLFSLFLACKFSDPNNMLTAVDDKTKASVALPHDLFWLIVEFVAGGKFNSRQLRFIHDKFLESITPKQLMLKEFYAYKNKFSSGHHKRCVSFIGAIESSQDTKQLAERTLLHFSMFTNASTESRLKKAVTQIFVSHDSSWDKPCASYREDSEYYQLVKKHRDKLEPYVEKQNNDNGSQKSHPK